MRDVLHGEDDRAAGFTAAQVIAKGRSRRRTRTAAVSGVALVAAGAVAVVPSALVGGSGSGHGRGGGGGVVAAGPGAVAPVETTTQRLVVPTSGSSPASSPITSTPSSPASPAAPSSSAPSVQVVQPGTIPIGGGYSVTLTKNSVTLSGHGGQVGPLYTDNGNQGPNSIGLQGCGTVVGGLYIGSGEVASGKVTVNGQIHALNIVTLAGHPGWSMTYVNLPDMPKWNGPMAISVYDAAGHELASFTSPPRH